MKSGLVFFGLFAWTMSVLGDDPVRPGRHAGDSWTNTHGMVFCWCPPGTEPGFWLGKYETTLEQFNTITRKNPEASIATELNHPRDAIRYDDIQLFVTELNRGERFFQRLPEDWMYSLPSASEWEYACRAGTDTVFYFGDETNELPKHANFADVRLQAARDDLYRYADPRFDDGQSHLAPVGRYPANPWGFHDMLGNLWEWTRTFGPDPLHPDGPGSPLACGGSWVSLPGRIRPDARHPFALTTERNFIGFRLALKRDDEKSPR